MNNLLKGIESAINNAIEEYSGLIVKKYNLDPKELEDIWNTVCKTNKITINTSVKKCPEVKTDLKKSTQEGDGCPYVFSKGKNSGETCNGKPKNGCQYCSKHSKFEGIGQTEKKVTPSKKSISKTSNTKKKSPEPKSTDIIIRKNPEINKFWDPKTELVFKSQDDRVVIASYRDDKLNKLSSDDIILCEQYGFKYDKNEVEDNLKELADNLKNGNSDDNSVNDSGISSDSESDDDIDEKPLKKPIKKAVEKKEAPKIVKAVEKKEAPKIVKAVEKKEAPKIVKAVEKKEAPKIIKAVEKKEAPKIVSNDKKSIKDIIGTVNDKAHDVENLLKEIQKGNDDDDEFEEEEDLDEDYEDEEEEELDEEY